MECPFELPVQFIPYAPSALQKNNPIDNGCLQGANGQVIVNDILREEADYIIQAINSHEKLLDICRRLSKAGDDEYPNESATRNVREAIPFLIEQAKQALKEAK